MFGVSNDEAAKQKAAALAALANGGSQALAAFVEQRKQLASDRAAATQAAMARAAQINAPEAGADLNRGIAAGYDRYAAAGKQAASSRADALARINAANANYFDQLRAAEPTLAAAATAAGRAKAGKTPGQVISGLGGKELASSLLAQEAQALNAAHAARADALARKNSGEASAGRRVYGGAQQRNYASKLRSRTPEQARSAFEGEAAQSLGLPAEYGRLLVPKAEKGIPSLHEKAAKKAGGTPAEFESSRAYKDAVDTFNSLLGQTNPDTLKLYTVGEANRQLRRELIEAYGHDFPALRTYVRGVYGV